MNFKKIVHSLLSENQNDISTVRVMAFISLLTGVAVGLYGVYVGKDLTGLSQVCGVFVGAAFTAKVAQKYAERE